MSTCVYILAQGVQSRLPDLAIPKQWLPLPACGETPILHRTLVQLWRLLGCQIGDLPNVTVINTPELGQIIRRGMGIKVASDVYFTPNTYTLTDPGNSSLKGARRTIDAFSRDYWGEATPIADWNVMLLGDVVYSWDCLTRLLTPSSRVTVCRTSDLSQSGGELWGVAWSKERDDFVNDALDAALERHPPFRDYQPGQLRHWYWAMNGAEPGAPVTAYAVDDYTDDVDVPADVKNLPLVAAADAADDLKRGITWPL